MYEVEFQEIRCRTTGKVGIQCSGVILADPYTTFLRIHEGAFRQHIRSNVFLNIYFLRIIQIFHEGSLRKGADCAAVLILWVSSLVLRQIRSMVSNEHWGEWKRWIELRHWAERPAYWSVAHWITTSELGIQFLSFQVSRDGGGSGYPEWYGVFLRMVFSASCEYVPNPNNKKIRLESKISLCNFLKRFMDCTTDTEWFPYWETVGEIKGMRKDRFFGPCVATTDGNYTTLAKTRAWTTLTCQVWLKSVQYFRSNGLDRRTDRQTETNADN